MVYEKEEKSEPPQGKLTDTALTKRSRSASPTGRPVRGDGPDRMWREGLLTSVFFPPNLEPPSHHGNTRKTQTEGHSIKYQRHENQAKRVVRSQTSRDSGGGMTGLQRGIPAGSWDRKRTQWGKLGKSAVSLAFLNDNNLPRFTSQHEAPTYHGAVATWALLLLSLLL